MEVKFNFVLLALISVFALVGAGPRPMLRGYPIGSVTGLDRDAGAVSVDMGKNDGVLKGFTFAVVDDSGHQVALITAKEIYPDLFWSDKLAPGDFANVKPGMQVRWLFTPEMDAVLAALKEDTVAGYKGLISRFPNSRYLPELIRSLPEDTLKELNPDYYEAWKSYTKEAFSEIIKKYPGTGFASAAQSEIKSIEAFDAEQAAAEAERAKRAAEAEAERKRQETLEEKMRDAQEKKNQKEALGKLVNNSTEAVKFVFDPPSDLPPTNVPPHSFADVRNPMGSFTYKVYKADVALTPAGGAAEGGPPPLPPIGGEPETKPQPLKEGSIDIQFDFWEADYP